MTLIPRLEEKHCLIACSGDKVKQGLCDCVNRMQNQALNIPNVVWRFCAYKSNKDYESGEHYFMKDFLDHTEMKVFSGEHSVKEKPLYPEYCSMYWKIETNAK